MSAGTLKKSNHARRNGMSRKQWPMLVARRACAVLVAITAGLASWTPVHAQQLPAGQAAAPRRVVPVNLAVFEGADVPVDLLQAFDAVIVDPASGFDPAAHPLQHTVWIAGTHAPAAGGTADSFVAQQIEPLWQRGYRGFLLDTPSALASLDAIYAAHPDAHLVVGGEHALQAALPHAAALYAVLSPALIRDASADGLRTSDIAPTERSARVAAAQAFIERTGVPVVSIERCPFNDRACARDTAAQVVAAGVTPYVTDLTSSAVGIGAIEVLPRKILVVQDPNPGEPLDETPGVRNLGTPLNYLGYDLQYADVNAPLPAGITPDRYAGIVVWLEGDAPRDSAAWHDWIDARIAEHVPVAFMGQFGFDIDQGDSAALDLQAVPGPFNDAVNVVSRDPMIGFEVTPKLAPRDLTGVRAGAASRTVLRVRSGDATLDPVAITPWGGYALSPFPILSLNGIGQERWALQPLTFLAAALRLPPMPAPSLTTENGRRLLMSHVDGDGFASRAEFPGADYSGQALYDQIFTRYRIPMTLSVIEGEVGPQGMYPQLAPRLEAIARKMFALPYVAIGTHTYSHPFRWEQLSGYDTASGSGDTVFTLNIPNYTFNIDREITGSIDYINSRLAPAGKQTVVLQWPGDCAPPASIVRKVDEAGVANINGGDTVITKSADSWNNIAPVGVSKGPGAYQVYAPNQDENVYTNDWTGPYYGFTRVLETFEMTDRPLRFKPIDIYYHMYSGTKVASLRALDQVFASVLKQPVLPIQITDYTSKVLDWRSFAVARAVPAEAVSAVPGGVSADDVTWIVRGNGNIRELHWARTDTPNLRESSGVTGFAAGPDGTYIHIADGAARVVFDAPRAIRPRPSSAGAADPLPYIAQANGFVRDFTRTPHGLSFEFGGYYEPFIELANAQRCSVQVGGRVETARRDGALQRFDTQAASGLQIGYQPVEITCER
jgi:hypothetical protein